MSNLMVINSTPAMMTAEQLFRAACGVYHIVFDDLRYQMQTGAFNPSNARSSLSLLQESEQGAFQALIAMVKGRPDEKAVKSYLATSIKFAKAWASCLTANIDPLSPQTRREMKSLFDAWKASEQAYARAGYRTIALDEWLATLLDDKMLKVSPIAMMVERRHKDEQPVFHAVAMARKYSKLKI